jgi:Txe/YoeB family toxin of toxin-antitoxin system
MYGLMYNIFLSRQAEKDARKLEQAGLQPKAAGLLRILRHNPFQNPPSYEKLQGHTDVYSRRITIQHRLVYQILPNEQNDRDAAGVPYQGIIKVIRMWTHYE